MTTTTAAADPRVTREPHHRVHELILRRWSPRAMAGEELTDWELETLFEAARWAPSSYNGQPWRFVYAKRATRHWWTLFNLLGEFNQKWAKDAGALVCVVSKTVRDGRPAKTHSFDTGAAWENLALQAAAMDLAVRAMEGFDYERARRRLGVPDDHEVEAMIAIGRPGDGRDLPDDLEGRERPSGRKPLSEFVFEGSFPT